VIGAAHSLSMRDFLYASSLALLSALLLIGLALLWVQ
jgi:hypothetical protein